MAWGLRCTPSGVRRGSSSLPTDRLLTRALRAVAILDIILRDEIGHVAVGNRWYSWLCAAQELEPLAHYRLLARRHQAPRLRPPFNIEARYAAGFVAAEIEDLQAER